MPRGPGGTARISGGRNAVAFRARIEASNMHSDGFRFQSMNMLVRGHKKASAEL